MKLGEGEISRLGRKVGEIPEPTSELQYTPKSPRYWFSSDRDLPFLAPDPS